MAILVINHEVLLIFLRYDLQSNFFKTFLCTTLSCLLLTFFSCQTETPPPKTRNGELYFPPNDSPDWESITPQALGWKMEKRIRTSRPYFLC